MPNIIIRNYEHVNRSLPNWNTSQGRYIRNKDDYDRAMKESGMVTYEKMQQSASNKALKDYSLSKEAKNIIESAKSSKDRRGKVKLSDKTIEAMQKIGAIGKELPKHIKLPKEVKEGGFYTI